MHEKYNTQHVNCIIIKLSKKYELKHISNISNIVDMKGMMTNEKPINHI